SGSTVERPLLHFFGVGGSGKSSLRQRAVRQVAESHASRRTLHLVQLDFDTEDSSTQSSAFDMLCRKLRLELRRQAKIELPLFDVYSLAWAAKRAGDAIMSQSEMKLYLHSSERVSDVLREVWDRLGDVAASIKGVNLVL